MQAKLTAAKGVLAAVDTAGAEKAIAIDERESEFEDLEKYAVNIKRTAEVEVNDEAFTKDLASIVRKPGKTSAAYQQINALVFRKN